MTRVDQYVTEHPLFEITSWRHGVSVSDWEAVLHADPCAYCGRAGGTIDHITPLAALSKGVYGRSSVKMNGTGSCPRCNNYKGDKKLLIFMSNRLIRLHNAELTRKRDHDRRMSSNFFSPEQIDLMRQAAG